MRTNRVMPGLGALLTAYGGGAAMSWNPPPAGRVNLPRGKQVRSRMWPGSHYRPRGANFEQGINAHKRSIPAKRKHRVRLRAHLEGRLHGRPLTAYERSWL